MAIATADMILRVWGATHSCPESFDLGNGLSGTCSVNSQGPIVHAIGSGGTPIDVDWWLYVHSAGSNGTSFVTDDGWGMSRTTWSGGGGSGLWLDGRVHTDGNGTATGFDFRLGDDSFYWRVTPSELQTEPSARFSIRIDRHAGTGTISILGEVTARLTLQGGCTTVDFVDPALQDQNGCLW